MTTINIATDIPSGINTLEKLVVWANLALAHINPQIDAIEGVGYTEKACQGGVFYVANDDKHRFMGRVSVVMTKDYLAGGTKLWQYANEFSTTALPATFKSN